jgi:hypothetical protein
MLKQMAFRKELWVSLPCAVNLCAPKNTTEQVPWQVCVSKAMDAVKDVVLDITDVLRIRDVSVFYYIQPKG